MWDKKDSVKDRRKRERKEKKVPFTRASEHRLLRGRIRKTQARPISDKQKLQSTAEKN